MYAMKVPKQKISIDDLLNSIGEASRVLGKKDKYVAVASPIDNATKESVTFCNKKNEIGLQMVRNSRAGVVICHDDLQLTADDLKDKTLILVSNPRLAFIRVIQKHFQEKTNFGISPTAVIENGAEIHPCVYIGHHCYIGKCKIGEGTIIYGNNYIYPNTEIGRNVIIHAGAVIGAEGAGFERNTKGELEKFPQIGGTIIEDNVEIGSNSSVMRGAMGNTVIGQGTKIGNLCYIGHGVTIGKHCLILQHSVLGGSSQIGDYSQVSLSACIRNKVEVGKNVLVGMGSVVTKNISDDKIVFGVPAKEQGVSQQ